MRRAIINEFEDLAEALSSYCTIFTYRLNNLCVKAEESSLLEVSIMVEGQMQNLEKCAIIAKDGDYDFMIFPKYDEDMMPIGKSILSVHPEFKQRVDTMKIDSADSDGNPKEIFAHYIRVTMPEVNDERYDVLKNGVDVAYKICKTQMEAANSKADVQLGKLTIGESEENIELIKQERDKLNKQWDDQRDKLYEQKQKEIEEAYQKWLSTVGEEALAKMEREEAHGINAGKSIRMTFEQ